MDKIAKSSQGGYIFLLKYMHVCVFLYIYLCVIYFYKCIHTERGEREGKREKGREEGGKERERDREGRGRERWGERTAGGRAHA